MGLFKNLFLALRNFFTSSICFGGALVLLATVIIAFEPYDGTNRKGAAGLNDPKDHGATRVADHKIALAPKDMLLQVTVDDLTVADQNIAPKDVLWQATADTLACLSKANIKKLQVLDARRKSRGVRTLKSKASKKDCVPVPRGTEIAVDAWDRDSGIANVFVRRVGRQRYMVAKDIGKIDVR